tara:strand:+ start:13714 stop:15024 length:1311 start_codon:yes stop_codon:yes gene_type:complete
MSKLKFFEQAVNNAIASKGSSEKLTVPLKVFSYNIDSVNPENSSVIGEHFFTQEPLEFRLNKSTNPNQPSINGFNSLVSGSDPRFDYSVPKNGVIMFMDCKKAEDGSYTAEWGKSAVRKNNQTIVNNFSTVKAVKQYGNRPPYIVFDSYVPTIATTLELNKVKSKSEIENLIIKTLEPKLGPDANRSIALVRIISPDAAENVLCFEIGATKKSNSENKQVNCNGSESFDRYTQDGMGKVIFKDGAIERLLGTDLTLEVIPGMSYYAGKSTAEPYFYTSEELKAQNKSAELLGALKPKTIISVWSNMLNKVEMIKDEAGNESKVRKPKVMNMYLTAAQLDDKTKLITAFNTETTNQPVYDLSEIPTEALLRIRGVNAVKSTQLNEQASPTASKPTTSTNDQTPVENTKPKEKEPQMFDSDLSESDIAELFEISKSMN